MEHSPSWGMLVEGWGVLVEGHSRPQLKSISSSSMKLKEFKLNTVN